ncbi:MAG: tRNA lysidine(34) synthetase TilS [Hyphomicrobiaceae bacterium]
MTQGDDAPLGGDERDMLLAPLASFAVIVLAVSGGSDSTALLHLVHDWARQHKRSPESLIAVTVDHGLRPESAAEAELVAGQARGLGIEHRTARWVGPAPAAGLQAAARQARYRLLSEVAAEKAVKAGGPAVIVTAHTADDQAETLVMRLARGSGVGGLASIPPISHVPIRTTTAGEGSSCAVLRPLLGVSRQRLIATLAVNAVPFSGDPSNRDRRFERVRVRQALDVLQPLGVSRDALARSARRLQSALEVLEQAADDLEARAVTSIAELVYDVDRAQLAQAPRETSVRLVRRLLVRAGGAAPPADLGAIETAVDRLIELPVVSAFTLGGCIVDIDRETSSTLGLVRIYREPDRDGGLPHVELMPGEAVRWDERFLVAVRAGYSSRVVVGPLGADWSGVLAAFPSLARVGLPRAAARGIPAFRGADGLLAVPLLAGLLRHLGEVEMAPQLIDPSEEAPGGLITPIFTTIPIREDPIYGQGPPGD